MHQLVQLNHGSVQINQSIDDMMGNFRNGGSLKRVRMPGARFKVRTREVSVDSLPLFQQKKTCEVARECKGVASPCRSYEQRCTWGRLALHYPLMVMAQLQGPILEQHQGLVTHDDWRAPIAIERIGDGAKTG